MEKRLIDANAMEQVFRNGIYRVLKYVASTREKEVAKITLEWCVSKLSKTTTVDAVEVVRCKDCKHLKYGYQCYCPLGMNLSNNEDAYVLVDSDDDFCSRGERREGD